MNIQIMLKMLIEQVVRCINTFLQFI